MRVVELAHTDRMPDEERLADAEITKPPRTWWAVGYRVLIAMSCAFGFVRISEMLGAGDPTRTVIWLLGFVVSLWVLLTQPR